MSETSVADLGAREVQRAEMIEASEVSKTSVADLRIPEVQRAELIEASEVSKTSVADLRSPEVQRAELIEASEVSQTSVADLRSPESQLAELIEASDVSQTSVADLSVREVQIAELIEASEVSQTSVADSSAFEVQHAELSEVSDVSKTSVADLGVKEVQHAELIEVSDVSKTSVADLGVKEVQHAELIEASDVSQTSVADLCIPDVQHAELRQAREDLQAAVGDGLPSEPERDERREPLELSQALGAGCDTIQRQPAQPRPNPRQPVQLWRRLSLPLQLHSHLIGGQRLDGSDRLGVELSAAVDHDGRDLSPVSLHQLLGDLSSLQTEPDDPAVDHQLALVGGELDLLLAPEGIAEQSVDHWERDKLSGLRLDGVRIARVLVHDHDLDGLQLFFLDWRCRCGLEGRRRWVLGSDGDRPSGRTAAEEQQKCEDEKWHAHDEALLSVGERYHEAFATVLATPTRQRRRSVLMAGEHGGPFMSRWRPREILVHEAVGDDPVSRRVLDRCAGVPSRVVTSARASDIVAASSVLSRPRDGIIGRPLTLRWVRTSRWSSASARVVMPWRRATRWATSSSARLATSRHLV